VKNENLALQVRGCAIAPFAVRLISTDSLTRRNSVHCPPLHLESSANRMQHIAQDEIHAGALRIQPELRILAGGKVGNCQKEGER